MEVKKIAIELLNQITEICLELKHEEYAKPLDVLSKSSLGAHNRHCIEFFQMLITGNDTGIVSYDNRKHDKEIENDPNYAITCIKQVITFLEQVDDVNLLLEAEYPQSGISTTVPTSLKREIIYNIEHLVHHMALIKIGIRENFPSIVLNPSFGIAQSTIAFQTNNK